MTPLRSSCRGKSRWSHKTGPSEHAVTRALVDLLAAKRCTTDRKTFPAKELSTPLAELLDDSESTRDKISSSDSSSSLGSSKTVDGGVVDSFVEQFSTISLRIEPALPRSFEGPLPSLFSAGGVFAPLLSPEVYSLDSFSASSCSMSRSSIEHK